MPKRPIGWSGNKLNRCCGCIAGCSLKQEEVYRHACEAVTEARKGIADYLRYCNEERPH